MLGEKFGQLTVIGSAPDKVRKRSDCKKDRVIPQWVVQCSCGSKSYQISQYYLISGVGHCKSCDVRLKNPNRTHGESRSGCPEYQTWKVIKVRCYNEKYAEYKDYGGRGITVCPEWLNSYETFLADMGRRPGKGYSIERRDNDIGYCASNCYWATSDVQRRNRRVNTRITIGNRTLCLVDWLAELGVKQSTYYWRVRNGQSQLEALGQ